MKATIEISEENIERLQGATGIQILTADEETEKVLINEDDLSYAIKLMIELCTD